MTFSDRLRFLMKRDDITQNSLANSLCVSQQTISRWVNNKFQPDIDQLIALARIFNVSIDYLVGLTDTPSIYFDTKKDPSPNEREQAIAVAAAARSGIPVNLPLPKDMQELSSLIRQIVDFELDRRSTPSSDLSQ